MVKKINPNHLEIKTLINPKKSEISEIGRLAEEAFIRFGHYNKFISDLLTQSNVITGVLIDKDRDDLMAGFILLGYIKRDDESVIVDILAIALEVEYRGQNFGRKLLNWAYTGISNSIKHTNIVEIRLTVAPDNEMAVKLFKRFGFEFVKHDIGEYPTGVEARYMVLRLDE